MASRPRTGCFAWTSPFSPCAKFQLTRRSASSTSRRLNAVSRRPRVDRPRVDPALWCIELSATRSSSAIRARTKLTTFISPLCRGTARPVPPCAMRGLHASQSAAAASAETRSDRPRFPRNETPFVGAASVSVLAGGYDPDPPSWAARSTRTAHVTPLCNSHSNEDSRNRSL
jgi:hypothetical protein